MKNEYNMLLSEKRELECILQTIPAEKLILRNSFSNRLEEVISKIKAFKMPKCRVASLTFRGNPVNGIKGISADFSSKAMGAFSELYSIISASISGDLSDRGRLPNRKDSRLLITGTAVGSFGFNFEIPENNSLNLFEDEKDEPSIIAIEKIKNLMESTVTGSDDDLIEVAEDIHRRSLKKMYDFLNILSQEKAVCGLEYNGEKFSYKNQSEINLAMNKLKEDNVHEYISECKGEIRGILPSSRNFEFVGDDVGCIKGRLGIRIENPKDFHEKFLYKKVSIKLRVLKIGEGRDRYILDSEDDIITDI